MIGFENIELISDRPFEDWIDDLTQLKKQYPDRMLIASIMEEYRKDAWQEIVERKVQETGVDGFELNLSCPHGLPERKMGMAMGENPDIVEEVVGWAKQVAKIPVWAKMTPNVGSPTVPAAAAARRRRRHRAINTILSVIGVDLETLRPMPTVEGYSVPGGYSGQAVRPIALRQIMEVARANPGVEISGIGGIETGRDAAQFFLLGASTVQVCTGAMLRGYEMIADLKTELEGFMREHNFSNLREFVGKSLPYFSTHADLGDRQKASREAKEASRAKAARGRDAEVWQGDIAKETKDLATN